MTSEDLEAEKLTDASKMIKESMKRRHYAIQHLAKEYYEISLREDMPRDRESLTKHFEVAWMAAEIFVDGAEERNPLNGVEEE